MALHGYLKTLAKDKRQGRVQAIMDDLWIVTFPISLAHDEHDIFGS